MYTKNHPYENAVTRVDEAMSNMNGSRLGWGSSRLSHYDTDEIPARLAVVYEMLQAKKEAVAELEAAVAEYETVKHLHAEWRDAEVAAYKEFEARVHQERS